MFRNTLTLILLFGLLTCLGGQTLQEKRWSAAQIRAERIKSVDTVIDRIMVNKARYEAVDLKTGVPWYIIAVLHNMEASGSFARHLHEGSPLTARTRYVPIGRPKTGNPPFTWEYSAIDALVYDNMGTIKWALLDATLYACERYNGTGYLRYHPTVPTPYLWSYTTIYNRGKYVSDGKWSSTAISEQVGCGAIWKRMEQRGIINFSRLKLSY